jgi:hypothetical protein
MSPVVTSEGATVERRETPARRRLVLNRETISALIDRDDRARQMRPRDTDADCPASTKTQVTAHCC